jgi:TPR repeat protein
MSFDEPSHVELSYGEELKLICELYESAGSEALQAHVVKYLPIGLDPQHGASELEIYQLVAGLYLAVKGNVPPGPFVGMALIKDLVRSKYLPAIRAVGILHSDGVFSGGNERAIAWLEKAVEEGSKESFFDLARIYETADSGFFNQKLADKHYELSAEAGDYRGQYVVGMRLAQGFPGKSDAKAAVYLSQAAESGHWPSQRALGILYELGQGVQKDPREALLWYERALETEVTADTLSRAALLCVSHPEFPGFLDKGGRYAIQAAEMGSIQAQFILAKMHSMGVAVKPSTKLAMRWFVEAAKQDSEIAILNLIYICVRGFGEIRQDLETAIKWAMRGLELDMPLVKYILSLMYRNGIGLERDKARADLLVEDLGQEAVKRARKAMRSMKSEFSSGPFLQGGFGFFWDA